MCIPGLTRTAYSALETTKLCGQALAHTERPLHDSLILGLQVMMRTQEHTEMDGSRLLQKHRLTAVMLS